MRPPCLIGGSTPPLGFASGGAFDAYCASIFAPADAVFDELFCLLESAGFVAVDAGETKARFYARNRIISDHAGKQLLAVKSGGSNPHPHVECYGIASPALAEYLRAGLPHRPTRIDHAVDVQAPGLFDQLHAYAVQLCKEHRLRGAPAGDWVTPDAGRTFYLGSRKSQVSVRIYEKGLKYARDLGLFVTPELRDWVRIELEFHPQTEAAKQLAVSVTGPQLWGSTLWTDQLAREVLSMRTQPVSIRERRESNRERALRFMGAQYSSHLIGLLRDCGGDFEKFGRAVADLAGYDADQGQCAA